ncbi:MAG TPA: 3-phosphoshikimate 1-carboxyvinyltransferase [Chitinophagaceae bacterium]
MIATVQPSVLSGTVQAPASKSSMQRACAAALVQPGITVLKNAGKSNDDLAALDVISELGAVIYPGENGSVKIESRGVRPVSDRLNCGESGLGVRMFTPVAALTNMPLTITGSGSLLNRPMDFFDEIFPSLGIEIKTNNGKLPFTIKGPLQPADINIDGSLSSQFLTGLLMAYAAANASDVTIKVKDLKSKPYIDLTLQVMKAFDLKLPRNQNYESFYFGSELHQPASQNATRHYTVEGDWSGAAFLLVTGAVAGDVNVQGIMNTSTQADKKIVDALLDAGADVKVSDDAVHVKRGKLEAFVFDATDCPDLFPPLVALAAHCNGISRIRGLKRLKHKESDRGSTLREEFDKLSTRIDLNDDEMLVYGNGGVFVKNHVLNSHHDHRIAMACAVAALGADFYVEIRNADAINKSYPDFFTHLQQLGADIMLQESSSGALEKK